MIKVPSQMMNHSASAFRKPIKSVVFGANLLPQPPQPLQQASQRLWGTVSKMFANSRTRPMTPCPPSSPARLQLIHDLYQQYQLSLSDQHPLTLRLLDAPEIKRIPWVPPGEFVDTIVQEISGILYPSGSNLASKAKGTAMYGIPIAPYWNRPTAKIERDILLEEIFPRMIENAQTYQDPKAYQAWFAGTDLLRAFMRSHQSFNRSRQSNENIVSIGYKILRAKNDTALWSKLMDRRTNNWARLLLLP